jgi:hypothetical protein
MEDDENDWSENIKAQKRQSDIKHRQIERAFEEQHTMRGRAGRDRQIEHERKKPGPQGLHALGRMIERGGQCLGLFRAGLAVAGLGKRFPSRVVEHRRHLRPSRAGNLAS